MSARTEQPGAIPARSWKDAHGSEVELTLAGGGSPGETAVVLHVSSPAIALTSTQLREIVADALERAEALDRVPGRYRRNPAWHIRQGELQLAKADEEPAPEWASARAALAAAHFQAALAQQSRTTVHITHHQSGEDSE